MRIAERAIEMPRLVLLAAASFCALGIAGVMTVPKERTPRIKLPVIMVAVPNPGATPRRTSGNPIEQSGEPITMSLASAKAAPAPSAGPCSAAMIGLGRRSIVWSSSRSWRTS